MQKAGVPKDSGLLLYKSVVVPRAVESNTGNNNVLYFEIRVTSNER
jgi:hypothetical protein